jgi:hypothetical protein
MEHDEFDAFFERARQQPGFGEAYARAQRQAKWRKRWYRVQHLFGRHAWVWRMGAEEPAVHCMFCPARRSSDDD